MPDLPNRTAETQTEYDAIVNAHGGVEEYIRAHDELDRETVRAAEVSTVQESQRSALRDAVSRADASLPGLLGREATRTSAERVRAEARAGRVE